MAATSDRPSILDRLGLNRPELRAWAMYDWANSAFMTTIIAAVFPIYYAQVAAKGLDPNDATFKFSDRHDHRADDRGAHRAAARAPSPTSPR